MTLLSWLHFHLWPSQLPWAVLFSKVLIAMALIINYHSLLPLTCTEESLKGLCSLQQEQALREQSRRRPGQSAGRAEGIKRK